MKYSSRAELLLLSVAFIWGTTYVTVKQSINLIDPFSFNFYRFSIAAISLLAWMVLFKRDNLKQITLSLCLKGFVLGFFLFAAYALLTFGLDHTSSSKAGFIIGLNVVLVPVFSCLSGHKFKPTTLASLGLTTIGLYLLTLHGELSVNRGDILALAGSCFFALHLIFTGRYTKGTPALSLSLIQIITVSFFSLFNALYFEAIHENLTFNLLATPTVFGSLFLMAIPATSLAIVIQTEMQKFAAPSKVALIYSLEPVFAAAAGFLFADERLGLMSIAGCGLIFMGTILPDLFPDRFKFHHFSGKLKQLLLFTPSCS